MSLDSTSIIGQHFYESTYGVDDSADLGSDGYTTVGRVMSCS